MVRFKYANGKSIFDFVFDSNSGPIYHHFRTVVTLTLTVLMGQGQM